MVGDLGPLCPPSHMYEGGGRQTLGLNTSKWVMPLGAHTLQVLRQRIHYNDGQCDSQIFVTRCHVTVTRACPVITSSHHPPQFRCHVTTPIRLFQIFGLLDDASTLISNDEVQCGKLFFRIDSMCNSVKCDTPCFMEWCHATNLSNSPVCSMSETLDSALLISFISMWAHLIAVNICVDSTDL